VTSGKHSNNLVCKIQKSQVDTQIPKRFRILGKFPSCGRSDEVITIYNGIHAEQQEIGQLQKLWETLAQHLLPAQTPKLPATQFFASLTQFAAYLCLASAFMASSNFIAFRLNSAYFVFVVCLRLHFFTSLGREDCSMQRQRRSRR